MCFRWKAHFFFFLTFLFKTPKSFNPHRSWIPPLQHIPPPDTRRPHHLLSIMPTTATRRVPVYVNVYDMVGAHWNHCLSNTLECKLQTEKRCGSGILPTEREPCAACFIDPFKRHYNTWLLHGCRYGGVTPLLWPSPAIEKIYVL